MTLVWQDMPLWCWGKNGYGQLGLGDATNRSSPVQIGSSADWHSIDASFQTSFALKVDGTLWAW